MAAQDNYWDAARGLWIDGATGNYMKPTDAGGDGIWYSPDGRNKLVNGQWVPVTASATSSGSGFTPQAGYGYDILDRAQAGAETLERLQGTQQKEIDALNNAARQQLQQADASLQLKLRNMEITSQQYMQAKQLAQQENEFARWLSLNQLQEKHKFEIDRAQTEINRAAEMRQERALQASLAANPQDWVAYEFYKRELGIPQKEAGVSSTAATGDLTTLEGNEYEEAPPAYDETAAQSIATKLFNPGGEEYNPNLKGEGVFGTKIESPNTFTRSEALNLSDSEIGMLRGLLKAGVNVGGKRVALDPDDYFQQAGRSWIPTWGTTNRATQYA